MDAIVNLVSAVTGLSNALSVAVVGVCVIFFVAVAVARMWHPSRHEEVTLTQSWDASGKPRVSPRRVK